MKISAVIPVHNEEEGLSLILPHLTQHISDIVVVDDASTDNTTTVCEEHHITHAYRPEKMGLGSAIRYGSLFAKHETILVMDGDGQHLVPDAIEVVNQHSNGTSPTITVGSRFSNKDNNTPGLSNNRRRFSILTTSFTRLFTSKSRDPLTGLFIAPKKLILNTSTNGYKILLQILLQNPKAQTLDVPITLAPRQGGESKLKLKEHLETLRILAFTLERRS